MSQSADECQRLAADLQESGFYYDIFRVSPASIAVLTLEGRRFVDVNDGFEALIGHSRSEVQGKTFQELGLRYEHENELPALSAPEDTNEETTDWENGHLRRADGTVSHVLGSFLALSINGNDLLAYKLIDVSRFHKAQRRVIETMEHEQEHIEQELREHICQQLSGLEYMMAGIRDTVASRSQEESQILGEITEITRQINRRIRRTVEDMVPTRLLQEGLAPALEHYARALENRYQINCSVTVDNDVDLTKGNASRHIYRMAQDAATIAANNERIERLCVDLERNGDKLILAIDTQPATNGADDSPENDEVTRAIRYRANLLGGTLATPPSRGGETTGQWRIILPTHEVTRSR